MTGLEAERVQVRAAAARRRVAAYTEFFVPVTDRFTATLAAAVPLDAGPALDVGAGPGRLAAALAGRVGRCVALDLDPLMLAAGHDDGVAGDAAALPVRTGSVGAVTAAFLVPHLDDPDRALAEVARVLRPGGTFALAGWADADASPFTGLAGSLLERDADDRVREPLAAARQRTSARWLVARVRAAGLTRIRAETVSTTVTIEGPGRWWRGMVGASVGLSQLLHVTEPAVRAVVQERFLAAAEDYRDGDALTVPVAAHVLTAIRA